MAKIGRNEQCPCQSGKKYKHCCALKEPRDTAAADSGTGAENNPDGRGAGNPAGCCAAQEKIP